MEKIRIETNIDVKKKAALVAVITQLDQRGTKNNEQNVTWKKDSKFRKKPELDK